MGMMDAFNAEDRTQVKVSQLYEMLREAAKCELLMNAVNCNVPHRHIREMATGEKEDVPELFLPSETVRNWAARVVAETEAKGENHACNEEESI